MSFGYCNIGVVAFMHRTAPGVCCSVVTDLLSVAARKITSLIACFILPAPQRFVKGFFQIARGQPIADFSLLPWIFPSPLLEQLTLFRQRVGLYNIFQESQGIGELYLDSLPGCMDFVAAREYLLLIHAFRSGSKTTAA
jgi:hypothetical protein